MPGQHLVIPLQVVQTPQRPQHLPEITALQVAPAAFMPEQRVAREQAVANPDDRRAGRMARGVHIRRRHPAERHLCPLVRQKIRLILHIGAGQRAELTHILPLEQPQIPLGYDILRMGCRQHLVRGKDMVKMRVRQQNIFDIQLFLFRRAQDRGGVVAWVDHRGLAALFIVYNITVRGDHAHAKLHDFHKLVLLSLTASVRYPSIV